MYDYDLKPQCNWMVYSERKLEEYECRQISPSYIGGGGADPPYGFLLFLEHFFTATYDETLSKFLLYTYEDSNNLIWLKKLSIGACRICIRSLDGKCQF